MSPDDINDVIGRNPEMRMVAVEFWDTAIFFIIKMIAGRAYKRVSIVIKFFAALALMSTSKSFCFIVNVRLGEVFLVFRLVMYFVDEAIGIVLDALVVKMSMKLVDAVRKDLPVNGFKIGDVLEPESAIDGVFIY
ncbi:MAG: hypothetical protein EAX96_17340 [Candidatus Lokiarchaeota archaeon]|nr:hypothetical protein [Candidatus Lokiarchaeota archaeon]